MTRVRATILFVLAGLASGCAAPATRAPDVDPAPIWQAWQRGGADAALAAAESLGWSAGGGVEGERLRQNLLIAQGRRGEAVAEVREWIAAEGAGADLEYLEARLLQDPDRQRLEFRRLLAAHPRHAWSRLGAASIAIRELRWPEALAHVRAAADLPAAREFRLQIGARIAAWQGRSDAALALLEEGAFQAGHRDLLLEYASLAATAADPVATERAAAELALWDVPATATLPERVDAAARRLYAELASGRVMDLDAALAFLDRQAARAGAPGGWAGHPRYTMPLVGALVRPEISAGGVAAAWLEHGRMLIAREALHHGLELLYLRDVQRVTLPWPGVPEGIEVALAGQGFTNGSATIVGGAVFRGFFLRRDLAMAVAAAAELETRDLDRTRALILPAEPARGAGLPEDWDLPTRLRARVLAETGADALRLELRHIALHEAGHLEEVLGWLPDGPNLLAELPRALYAALFLGGPLGWMEYRAQLRALTAAPEPHWALADLVQRTRMVEDPYRRPYAAALRDLLATAAADGLPPLPLWHELGAEPLRALASRTCGAHGVVLLPAAAVGRLLEALDDLMAAFPE